MCARYIEAVDRKLSISNELLLDEALKRGIKIEVLPKKRFKMSSRKNSYKVRKGKVVLAYNSRLATRTMDMKEVTSRIFRSKGFNSPENTVFSKVDIERAWKWAEPILPIVVKPHAETVGRLVFVNINNYSEFKECFKKVTEKHEEVLIEKYIEGKEYRFTYVNKEIVAIAHRIPANIVGDGESNVKSLIELKNIEREKSGNPTHKLLKIDEESQRVLNKHGHSYDYVPSKNEVIYLRDNSNVSTGGDAVDVTEIINENIKEYVRKAMISIPGLKACGVDVLINKDEINILEVNTNPMISLHHYPWQGHSRNVASKIIDGMFPETRYK